MLASARSRSNQTNIAEKFQDNIFQYFQHILPSHIGLDCPSPCWQGRWSFPPTPLPWLASGSPALKKSVGFVLLNEERDLHKSNCAIASFYYLLIAPSWEKERMIFSFSLYFFFYPCFSFSQLTFPFCPRTFLFSSPRFSPQFSLV